MDVSSPSSFLASRSCSSSAQVCWAVTAWWRELLLLPTGEQRTWTGEQDRRGWTRKGDEEQRDWFCDLLSWSGWGVGGEKER